MDASLGIILFITIVLAITYKRLQRSKYVPSSIIIGRRTYFDTEHKLFVNVIDYDGINVFYTYEDESEIAEPMKLSETDFLIKFKKVPRPVRLIDDDYPIQ